MNNLEENWSITSFQSFNQLMIGFLKLRTFLKTSRLQIILPKHSNGTGSCAYTMTNGKIRLISFGKRYQAHRSIVRWIFWNASINRWLSSQAMNTVVVAKIPHIINRNRSIMFPWCIWKKMMKIRKILIVTEYECKTVLNQLHLNNQQGTGNGQKAPCEQWHEYGLKDVWKVKHHSENVNRKRSRCCDARVTKRKHRSTWDHLFLEILKCIPFDRRMITNKFQEQNLQFVWLHLIRTCLVVDWV